MSDARTDPRLAAKTTRLADLRRLRDGHVERLARIEARAARWSWLRLLSFAGAGLIALLLLPVGGVAPAGLALIAGGLLFLWIMRRHLGLEAALLRRRARIDLIEEQLEEDEPGEPGLESGVFDTPLVELKDPLDSVDDPLLDDPVTGAGNEDLWVGEQPEG